MLKIHVISNLWLEDNEWTTEIDETLPECDLVIVNGNCGIAKRAMLYIEILCKKYPEKQFIYNLGSRDIAHQKSYTQIPDGLLVRQLYSDLWPTNLHYSYKKPFKINIKDTSLDVFCLHGYPNVVENAAPDSNWKSTLWYRNFYHEITHDQTKFKASEAANVYHGHYPIWSTPNLCRKDHDVELETINDWLSTPSDGYKVLVTTFSPFHDLTLPNIEYTMYENIQPDYWFVGGAKIDTILGKCQLHGNPGRGSLARNTVFTMESS